MRDGGRLTALQAICFTPVSRSTRFFRWRRVHEAACGDCDVKLDTADPGRLVRNMTFLNVRKVNVQIIKELTDSGIHIDPTADDATIFSGANCGILCARF